LSSGGGAEPSSWKKIESERFRLLDSTGECSGALRSQDKGQHGWRIVGVEQWLGAELTCGGGHGRDSCARGAKFEFGGLGDAADHTEKLLRRLAVTDWRRNSETSAALVPCSNSGNAAVLY
jgi:hypothetical protein